MNQESGKAASLSFVKERTADCRKWADDAKQSQHCIGSTTPRPFPRISCRKIALQPDIAQKRTPKKEKKSPQHGKISPKKTPLPRIERKNFVVPPVYAIVVGLQRRQCLCINTSSGTRQIMFDLVRNQELLLIKSCISLFPSAFLGTHFACEKVNLSGQPPPVERDRPAIFPKDPEAAMRAMSPLCRVSLSRPYDGPTPAPRVGGGMDPSQFAYRHIFSPSQGR